MAGINVFEVFAKIGLDTSEYEKKLGDSESKTSSFASSIGQGLKTAAKIGVTALSAVATGVGALAKQSVEAYAEYEQLVGGVQTLYNQTELSLYEYAESVGKTADAAFDEWAKMTAGARIVQNNADEAYRTAGLSANEYMSTVTSFSASLISSLAGDTVKAAEYADMAIVDMADNANKMGTSIELIQNAYQGFAKQNYTMLDNLKLGYGGTKEEMQRLLTDAEKIAGKKFDLSSYADIVEAIHVIQDEMGIAGATAAEAATTIEGSLNSMKAAWQNVLVGMADDESDFDTLIENLVSSVSTFADNIMPRIGVALSGAANLISSLIPVIVNEVPTLLNESLPTLLTAASDIITALSTGLADNAALLIQSALDILLTLFNSLIDNAPVLLDAVLQILTSLVEWVAEYTYVFARGALDLIMGLANALINNIPELIPAIVWIITEIATQLYSPENLQQLLYAALILIVTLGKALVESFPQMLSTLQMVVDNIIEFFTNEENRKSIGETAWELGKMLVKGLWEGVKSMASWIGDKLKGWFDGLIGDVKDDQEVHSPSRKWARV